MPGNGHYPAARMDLDFTDEQSDFAEAIRDFCRRECGTPEQRERLTSGHTELHSAEIYSKLAELGWLGVTIDEELGGSGGGMVDACIFMEETSRGLAPINGYATTLIVAGAVQRFGTDEQKREILGGIAGGAVEAIAMTEPEAGSDVGSLTTSAERANGGFVLNGQKVFCSNAHIADHVLVVCRTAKGESKHDGRGGAARGPGRDADDGRLRVLLGVRHGAPRPPHPRRHDLRRHLRDPAQHHRQDARALGPRGLRGRPPGGMVGFESEEGFGCPRSGRAETRPRAG